MPVPARRSPPLGASLDRTHQLARGLLLAYPLAPGGTASLIQDVGPLGMHATPISVPAAFLTPGPHGQRMEYAGVTTTNENDRATTGVRGTLVPADSSITVAGWYYRRTAGATAGRVFSFSTSGADQVQLLWNSTQMEFSKFHATTTALSRSNTAPATNTNSWVYFAVWFNINDLTCGFYVGDLNTTPRNGLTSSTTGAGTRTTADRLVIANTIGVSRAWDGFLGPIAAWNRVLTPEEIKLHWRDPHAFLIATRPAAIPSVAAAQTVSLVGTGSDMAVGQATFATTYAMATMGIGSGEALGPITLAPGAVALSPVGIGSVEALGAPSLLATYTLAMNGIKGSGGRGFEELGNPLLNMNLAPMGIDSAQAMGNPALAALYALAHHGIGSGEALGNITTLATYALSLAGIGSGEALGNPALLGSYALALAGIGSGQAMGNPALALALAFLGIGSSEALGSITMTPGAVTLSPLGIATAGALGQAIVALGGAPAQTVSLLGIPGTEALGNISLATTYAIGLTGIGSGQALGLTSLQSAYAMVLAGIGSAEALGAMTFAPIYTIAPTGIGSGQAPGYPTLLGSYALAFIGVPGGAGVGSPTTAQGAVTIFPFGIGSAEAFGATVLTPGAVAVTATGIPSLAAVGNSAVSVGALTLLLAGIGSGEAFGSPLWVPGPVTLTPSGIASDAALGYPSTTSVLSLTAIGIASGSALGSTLVAAGSVTLTPIAILSHEAFGVVRVYIPGVDSPVAPPLSSKVAMRPGPLGVVVVRTSPTTQVVFRVDPHGPTIIK